jgi:ATP-binding cassette subfamily C protein CydC
MANTERLTAAAEARVLARQADEPLRAVRPEESRTPTIRATYDHGSLRLSATPARDAHTQRASRRRRNLRRPQARRHRSVRERENHAADAIAGAPQPEIVTAVLADDYVFPGTMADNIRLANPAASDGDMTDLLTSVLLDGLEPETKVGACGCDLPRRRTALPPHRPGHRYSAGRLAHRTTGHDTSTAAHVIQAVRRRLPGAGGRRPGDA